MTAFDKKSTLVKSNPEAGFGMTLIAITIAIIMGISVSVYMQQVSTQSLQFQDIYTAKQAHWSALSGLEFGFQKSEIGEANFGGPYNFYNSVISIDTSETNETGGALAEFRYRVISRATYGDSKRNLRILAKMSMKTVWGDVSLIEGSGDVQIKNGMMIHDSLYIGQNVNVEVGTVIGDPPGYATRLYIPPGKVVTGGQEDAYFTVGQHSKGWIFAPVFDTVPYDSLLAICTSITADTVVDGVFYGPETMRSGTLDLSLYPDSTMFVNGVLKLQGMFVTGGSAERPAIIVVSNDLICSSRLGVETIVDDNIMMISGDILELDNATAFGSDQSALLPKDRPNLHNEVFARDDVIIRGSAVCWGQAYATDDITVEGELHGMVYAPNNFRFTKTTSYIEGAMFAVNIIGSSGPNRMDRGTVIMDHFFHQEYFQTFDFGVINNSLLEF